MRRRCALARRVEHVGSTAVPGLTAKPIIELATPATTRPLLSPVCGESATGTKAISAFLADRLRSASRNPTRIAFTPAPPTM
ncbi:GrpB family protein [Amycolatopsis sp. VS8301801F10]|uniref:GrpB family protein n=1 Tax=unclassified Amycolatopsis TaxID=2618356 RepID=UPI0038FC3232